MTREEFTKYWRPARNRFLNDFERTGLVNKSYIRASKKLQALLEITEHDDFHQMNEYPMNDKVKNILIALAGPHGATIKKILELKKKEKADDVG